jgi:hypothetical protein
MHLNERIERIDKGYSCDFVPTSILYPPSSILHSARSCLILFELGNAIDGFLQIIRHVAGQTILH